MTAAEHMRGAHGARHWRRVDVVSALALLAFALWIASGLQLQDHADDQYFLHALDQRGLWDFLAWRYQTWSGRVLSEAVLVTVISRPLLWTVAIPLTLLLAAWCVGRLTLRHCLPPATATVAALLVLLSGHRLVRWEAAYWVTGFHNYLLPLTCALLVCVLLDAPRARRCWPLAIVPALMAGQSEQAAMVLLLVLAVRAWLRRQAGRAIGAEIGLGLGCAVAAAGMLAAPGNAERLRTELRWLPEFEHMDALDKLALGLERINSHVHSPANLLIVLAATLGACLAWRSWRTTRSQGRRCWTSLACALLLAASVGASLLQVVLRVAGLQHWPRLGGVAAPLTPAEWSQPGIYVSFAFALAVYVALAASAAVRARDRGALAAAAGLPLLALATTWIVALSPTIHASGFRILFAADVLVAAHACLLLSELLPRRSPPLPAT